MANKEITELDASAGLVGTEEFPVQVDADTNEKVTATQIGLFTGMPHPGFIAGNWYIPFTGGELAAGAALANGTIKFFPFCLPKRMTVSDLGCRITTLAAAGNVQLAIYGSDPATGLITGNALAVTASIGTGSAGPFSADITGSNVTLEPGLLYWMAVNADNATVVLQIISGTNTLPGFIAGTTSLSNVTFAATGAVFIRTFASAFNTWPDMTGQTTTVANSNAYGIVFLKAA